MEGELQALPEASESGKELNRMILDAHKELMALNEKNEATFRDLADLLESESGAPSQ